MRELTLTALLLAACDPPDHASPNPLLVTPALAPCDPSAPWPPSLRVATWNIEAARSSSIDDIVALLESLGADVILLQEVDVGVKRTNYIDEPHLLADRLHANYAFAESIPFDGGHYGLAVISRLPFVSVTRIPLTADGETEDRIGLDITLCAGPTILRVVDTHADIFPPAGSQNALDLVNGLARASAIGPGLLVGGDFNALPTDPGPRGALNVGLTDLAVGSDESPTWQDRREDYLFADSRVAPACTTAHVIVTDKSDHAPLTADLTTPF